MYQHTLHAPSKEARTRELFKSFTTCGLVIYRVGVGSQASSLVAVCRASNGRRLREWSCNFLFIGLAASFMKLRNFFFFFRCWGQHQCRGHDAWAPLTNKKGIQSSSLVQLEFGRKPGQALRSSTVNPNETISFIGLATSSSPSGHLRGILQHPRRGLDAWAQ